MTRPIAISLSPNTEEDDIKLALKTIFSPWRWKNEEEVLLLEKEFANRFGGKYQTIAINSGRSALYLILKALEIGKGDEIIIQAFTCVAVPNSIIWTGAKPIYADIDETYNIDPIDLEKKITAKTKAIIIQHTFGIPAKIEAIKKIATKRNILLIEDCAHSLGVNLKGKEVGTFGDVSFFSFGRDKIISSVFGGMILCSNKTLYKKLKKLVEDLPEPSSPWTLQQLFHPVAMSFILPVYKTGLGKVVLFLFQKLSFLSKAVYETEKMGGKPFFFPGRFPGGLALLTINQLKKLERYNNHRRQISSLYFRELKNSGFILPPDIQSSVWLRFPTRHPSSAKIFKYAKNKGILLGDWYRGIIPPCYKLDKVFYREGSCPKAEEYAQTILNLPTYPTLSKIEAKKVIGLLKEWKKLKQN